MGQGDPLIKRLIGLPGDTLTIRDGGVYLNGAPLMEPYLSGETTSCTTYCGPLTLGPDEYFFLGDNRPVSRDSRAFGPIAAEQIVGQVILRYWPPARVGIDL
jgi:signal peptidase I